MSTVEGVHSTYTGTLSLEDAGYAMLDPETVMAHCRVMMQHYQHDIGDRMRGQRALLCRREAVQQAKEAFTTSWANRDGDPSKDDVITSLDDALYALPEGDPTRQALWEIREDLKHSDKSSKETWDSFTERLDDLSDQLGKEGEMEMIELQSAMSSQQTIVQMITNLLSKLGQTNQAVAQNI